MATSRPGDLRPASAASTRWDSSPQSGAARLRARLPARDGLHARGHRRAAARQHPRRLGCRHYSRVMARSRTRRVDDDDGVGVPWAVTSLPRVVLMTTEKSKSPAAPDMTRTPRRRATELRWPRGRRRPLHREVTTATSCVRFANTKARLSPSTIAGECTLYLLPDPVTNASAVPGRPLGSRDRSWDQPAYAPPFFVRVILSSPAPPAVMR